MTDIERALLGELTPFNHTTSIWLDDVDAKLLSEYAAELGLRHRWNELNGYQAITALENLYKIYPSVSKCSRKRFMSIINMILHAYGPDFAEQYRQKV